jgi:acetylornithine/succinyldiaminopimelate/putrescine aminotransferase
VTGRIGVIGFERSMHGKSLATALLAWDNRDEIHLAGFVRLPFPATSSEGLVLDHVQRALESRTIGAVFVEPIQGSGGGHRASPAFYCHLHRLCREFGALLVFDEILTGFYRTGPRFFFDDLGFVPDIILIGKAMGNGFPISAVVVDRQHRIERRMLPGSTFSGNPLAAAAAASTLVRMKGLDMPRLVAEIERIATQEFGELSQRGLPVRGRGAMWILELPSDQETERIAIRLWQQGVAIGFAGRYLRILPAVTIRSEQFRRACALVRDQLLCARDGRAES